jgi:hypothetical protein
MTKIRTIAPAATTEIGSINHPAVPDGTNALVTKVPATNAPRRGGLVAGSLLDAIATDFVAPEPAIGAPRMP